MPDARDIIDELTSRGARLNLAAAEDGPRYAAARLLSTVVSIIAEFAADPRTRRMFGVARCTVYSSIQGAGTLSRLPAGGDATRSN